jgi:hypothetical protein
VIIPNILTYLAEQSNQSGKLIHPFTELEREFFLVCPPSPPLSLPLTN